MYSSGMYVGVRPAHKRSAWTPTLDLWTHGLGHYYDYTLKDNITATQVHITVLSPYTSKTVIINNKQHSYM